MQSYCSREVEPMGKECEQVHIIAIAELLGVVVAIEYLDGRLPADELSGLSKVECGGSLQEVEPSRHVRLLYRPGHYDILYA